VHHVPRDQQIHRELKPVYISCPGWKEDITGARKWADLPAAAQRYVAMMLKSTLDVAYHGEARPATLPNLRYLGVGPLPSQIIKDVPETEGLLRLAN
jgi:adenylosuccinate synthase